MILIVLTVSTMAATFGIAVTTFAPSASPISATSPISREDAPREGEQGHDGHEIQDQSCSIHILINSILICLSRGRLQHRLDREKASIWQATPPWGVTRSNFS
jgi:hypothetical protein